MARILEMQPVSPHPPWAATASLAHLCRTRYLPARGGAGCLILRPFARRCDGAFLRIMDSQPISVAIDLQGHIDAHHKRLVGWLRARVGNFDDAEDLAQRAWIEVLQHRDSFDPEKGTFWTFAKIWAGFVLRRHWRERARLPIPGGDRIDVHGDGDGAAASGHDDPPPEVHLFHQMLRVALSCRRLPHEIVVFGFVKLLQWKPRRVVEVGAPLTVAEALALLAAEYHRDVPLPDVRGTFSSLEERLESPLGSCDVDPRVLAPYAHLRARPAASIRFEELFATTSNPEEAVTRWWAAVVRVVEADLLRLCDGPLAEWLEDQGIVRDRRVQAAMSQTIRRSDA